MQFKNYLLTEEKVYLGQKVGDILTALQNLDKDASNLGKRHLMRLMKNIVRQIRRVLHSNWTFEEEKHLKVLQKVGVALMVGIDSPNEDLQELVASATTELQNLSDKLETPIDNLGSPISGKSGPKQTQEED